MFAYMLLKNLIVVFFFNAYIVVSFFWQITLPKTIQIN